MVLGVMLFFAALYIPYRFWQRISLPLLVVSIFFCFLYLLVLDLIMVQQGAGLILASFHLCSLWSLPNLH
jgi:hypothetical protein